MKYNQVETSEQQSKIILLDCKSQRKNAHTENGVRNNMIMPKIQSVKLVSLSELRHT